MAEIVCVPLDGFPPDDATRLVEPLTDAFQKTVRVGPILDTKGSAFDPVRGQVNSTALLHQLQMSIPEPGDHVLGLIPVDLFIPIFTYVFGEAQLDGPAAVVSGFRLRTEFYGLEPDAKLFHQRLVKESIHELGHTFGLRHCLSQGCVMEKSTYVENIDLKTERFCRACHTFVVKKNNGPSSRESWPGR